MTPFQKHIQAITPRDAKRKYGICERTLRYWKSGEVQPSMEKAKKIRKLTGLTMTEIYG